MSIGGGASKAPDLQQGQFEFGPSQFDQQAINDATGSNITATENRYNQLGMGGSTPEQQDVANQSQLGQAAAGQIQTSEVTNPAFNPALQTAQQSNPAAAQGGGVSLGSLAGSAASLGGLL